MSALVQSNTFVRENNVYTHISPILFRINQVDEMIYKDRKLLRYFTRFRYAYSNLLQQSATVLRSEMHRWECYLWSFLTERIS